MSATRDGEKLIGVELLRFLAALSVLIFHYHHFLFNGTVAPAASSLEQQPLYGILAPLYERGNAGVQLFWCISGFIFAWKYRESIRTRAVSAGSFTLARFSRLYPLHLVTLLLAAALNALYFARHGDYFVLAFNDLKHFLLNLGFASYWGFQDDRSFNGPVWSVSVEIPVYALFFCLSRVFRGALWGDIAIAVAASTLYAVLRKHGGVKFDILGGVMFFYIGAAASRVHGMILARPDRVRRVAAAACAALVAAGMGLTAAGVLRIAGVSVVVFPAAILLAQFWIRPRHERVRRGLTGLGDMTYASYMIHFPLQIAMVLTLEALSIDMAAAFRGPWLLPLFLGLTLGLSVLVYRGFERPARQWLRTLGRATVDGAGLAGAVAPRR